jgi:hypothetical protein
MNITDNGMRNAACGRREMGDVGGAKLDQLEKGLRGRGRCAADLLGGLLTGRGEKTSESGMKRDRRPTPVPEDETGPDGGGDPKQPSVRNREWVGETQKWDAE